MSETPPAQTQGEPATRTDFQIRRAAGEPLLTRWRRLAWQRLRGLGYSLGLYRLRLGGRHPIKLLASPGDVWPGSPERAAAFLEGTITLAGVSYDVDNDLWSRLADTDGPGWTYFHSFAWLSDLAQLADQSRARDCALTLTRAWIDRYPAYDAPLWRPELLAPRVIQWMVHVSLILSSADMVYRSALLNNLASQARHLARTAGDAPDGAQRIAAYTALIMTGLLIPNGASRARKGEAALKATLDRLVLQDGGMRTRRTSDVLTAMQHLILLRKCYRARDVEIPEWLGHALDKQAPFLRAVRHGDGKFAAFNGAGTEDPDLIDRTLAASEARGRPIDNAAQAGYFRLKSRATTVILDGGPPPPEDLSTAAHAGTLAFEMSDGRQPIIANMGGPADEPEINRLTRTTAAHSTLVLADRNSTEIRSGGRLGRGVEETLVSRIELGDGEGLVARHNGYVGRFGLAHQRSLYLDAAGTVLKGEDRLQPVEGGRARRRPVTYDLRFHLASDVAASPTQDGHSIILRLANRHGWQFRADGRSVTLEESLSISAGGRARRSLQMVVSGRCNSEGVAIFWQLQRLDTRN